jgi:hypothetical protein
VLFWHFDTLNECYFWHFDSILRYFEEYVSILVSQKGQKIASNEYFWAQLNSLLNNKISTYRDSLIARPYCKQIIKLIIFMTPSRACWVLPVMQTAVLLMFPFFLKSSFFSFSTSTLWSAMSTFFFHCLLLPYTFNPSLNNQSCIKGLLVVRNFCSGPFGQLGQYIQKSRGLIMSNFWGLFFHVFG